MAFFFRCEKEKWTHWTSWVAKIVQFQFFNFENKKERLISFMISKLVEIKVINDLMSKFLWGN